MASTKTVQNQGNAGNTPVTSGIHKAAERIGHAVEPAADPRDAELARLRALANAAELIFEYRGEVIREPSRVLREALRTAGDDFAIMGDADGVPSMAFRRAELRCQLALELFEYRQEFGFPESDEGGAS